MSTAAEREKARQGKSAAAIAALDAAEQGKRKAKPKPKPKPKEKAGAGRALTAETESARVKALKTRLASARKAGNQTFVDKINAQLAAIRAAK